MIYKNILFDLDGTLHDPYPGMAESLRYALGKSGPTHTCESVPSVGEVVFGGRP